MMIMAEIGGRKNWETTARCGAIPQFLFCIVVLTWKTWPKLPSPTLEPTLNIASLSIRFPLALRASQRGAEAAILPREFKAKIGLAKGAGRKTSFLGWPMGARTDQNLRDQPIQEPRKFVFK